MPDFIVVPEQRSGANEDFGMTTYRPSEIIYDPNVIPTRTYMFTVHGQAHESGHVVSLYETKTVTVPVKSSPVKKLSPVA